jgi:hypothetical protein
MLPKRCPHPFNKPLMQNWEHISFWRTGPAPVPSAENRTFAAAFIQGLTVGALVEGLPWANGQHAGGDFGCEVPADGHQ